LREALKSGKLQLEAKTRVEAIIEKFNPKPTPPPPVFGGMDGVRADIPIKSRQLN